MSSARSPMSQKASARARFGKSASASFPNAYVLQESEAGSEKVPNPPVFEVSEYEKPPPDDEAFLKENFVFSRPWTLQFACVCLHAHGQFRLASVSLSG